MDRVDDLRKRTEKTGREHGEPVFVDVERESLVFGRITMGTNEHTRVDATPQPGRELLQRIIATMHAHPKVEVAHGLSTQDYLQLLSYERLQAEMLVFDENMIMVLKTSVTPNNDINVNLEHKLQDLDSDYFRSGISPVVSLIDFNKAVCSEFGLVMYMGNASSGGILTRVEVTK